MKLCGQMDRIAGDFDGEVRSIGAAFHFNAPKNPAIASLRSKLSGDAAKDRQVRVLESVGPGDWSVPRFALLPRAAFPNTLDITRGLRVGERGTKGRWRGRADAAQRETSNIPPKRLLARILRKRDQRGAIGNQFIDYEVTNLSPARTLVAGSA